MLTGNKGEWSELYVLTYLLSEGKLFQSDINLERENENYYEIVKAYKDEVAHTLEFERKDHIYLTLIEQESKNTINKFTSDYLKKISQELYLGIINGKGKSFKIPSVESFLNNSKIQKLTAKTNSKSDLRLRIYDHRLAKESDLGFSIKSLLGEDSTLFNTGTGNNFIYKIIPKKDISIQKFNQQSYKPSGGISKLTYRLQELINQYSSDIVFQNIQSAQLWRNLKMVDGDLPEIISHCLLYRWVHRTPILSELVNILEEKDPLNFYNGENSIQKLYEYKIKKFLAECAMGMTSETPWHGVYDATGGVIICKKDGDVVCFHIYDFNLFRDYLLKNTKFEQPSTGEDEENPGFPRTTKGTKKYYYGWLYENNNELFFKINLQIRFN
jgi:hypothetical protein